ncbi:MAG: type VI secretion system baseplate subunit TssE [Gemmatirosa sp.]|nr:type VI secretion system baseplate subunit TssE [Gemmatirosa sp.]
MARTEIERTVQPSVLDRLTDLEPNRPTDGATTRDASALAFRLAVQRDVEWLLNTRRSIVVVPPNCPEVHDSVHEFGLPDTTGIPVGTAEGRELLVTALQDTLARFEPRLANPRVTLGEAQQLRVPQLRFSVDAMLRMDPSPEHVVFDTVLEVASGEYAIDGDGA